MTGYIKHLYIVIFIDPTDCEKVPFLDFIEKNTTSILTTSSLSAQCFDGTKHIELKVDQTSWQPLIFRTKWEAISMISEVATIITHSKTLFILDDIIADKKT